MTKTAGLGKRAEHRLARRAEFIAEAAKVFLEFGLRDATMDDVAAKLGVSKVVVYRYFSSKEDLVDSILVNMTNKLLEQDRLPFAGYNASLKRAIQIAREDPAAFLLLARDAKSDPIFTCHHKAVWQGVTDRLVGTYLDFGMNEFYARMSGEALMSYSLNVQVYWIEHGCAERDEEFEIWAAAGLKALDQQWRQNYAASLAEQSNLNKKNKIT
jgi:AcrR family transcriptional regulator